MGPLSTFQIGNLGGGTAIRFKSLQATLSHAKVSDNELAHYGGGGVNKERKKHFFFLFSSQTW